MHCILAKRLPRAASGNPHWKRCISATTTPHALLQSPARRQWPGSNTLCGELAELLQASSPLHAGRTALERIHGMGEVLDHFAARAFGERGGDYALLDARDVLVVRHTDLGAVVDWEQSAAKLAEAHAASASAGEYHRLCGPR